MMSWWAGASKDNYESPSKAILLGKNLLHQHVATEDPTSAPYGNTYNMFFAIFM